MMQETPQCSSCLAEQPVHSLLPALPAEIIVEILRYALICSGHLAFCPGLLAQEEAKAEGKKYPGPLTQRFCTSLRLARWNHCQFGERVAKKLFNSFSILSLVSKEMRNTTRRIFFTENKWVLHVTRAMNAIRWITNHWGVEVLGMMRDVWIEVQVLKNSCFDALEVFVEVANQGMLKSLHVQWLEASRSLQVARRRARGLQGSWHFHPMCRDYGLERNSGGGRGLVSEPGVEGQEIDELDMTKYTGPGSEPKQWEEDEQV